MQEMSHLCKLRIHVELVLLVTRHLYRFASHDLQTEGVKAGNLQRIVGHKDKLVYAEVGEYACSRAVFAEVSGKAERDIRLYSVHSLVLQLVCLQFVQQTYAASFLTEIQQYAASALLYAAHGLRQLLAAVTAETAESVTCETL